MSDLIERLRIRAQIRRQVPTRKSVQEGQPDRLADLLDEAADALEASVPLKEGFYPAPKGRWFVTYLPNDLEALV